MHVGTRLNSIPLFYFFRLKYTNGCSDYWTGMYFPSHYKDCLLGILVTNKEYSFQRFFRPFFIFNDTWVFIRQLILKQLLIEKRIYCMARTSIYLTSIVTALIRYPEDYRTQMNNQNLHFVTLISEFSAMQKFLLQTTLLFQEQLLQFQSH